MKGEILKALSTSLPLSSCIEDKRTERQVGCSFTLITCQTQTDKVEPTIISPCPLKASVA